ncbi:MAG: S-adenosylmethionine uptake transporter [Sphingomonadales bacterium]|jgi:S-adenosylmethionine uptake transporter|nr:S-adenosylmethionine uptake transporter [Sphingomonadales bacterium]
MAGREQQGVAIPFAVAALGIALFSTMDALMKGLSLAIGPYNALLWRTMAGALLGGAVFFGRGSRWPTGGTLRVHLLRGTLSSVMAVLFFWGLARVPMAQAIALAFIAPLIALYLAALFLKEKIQLRAILASLLGFAGVIAILAGQIDAHLGPEALRGSIAILLSACLYAGNIVLMRRQAQLAGPVEVAFFMSAIMSTCFLVAAPWLAEWPGRAYFPALISAALLAFGSLMLLAWAYARAEAQHLAPVEYTGFVWAAFFGWTVFAEPVRPFTLAGAAMIVAACWVAARAVPAAEVHAEGL